MQATVAEVTVAGHFGELIQGRFGPEGVIALLTLPCAAFACRALHSEGDFALAQPGVAVLHDDDLRNLLAALDLPAAGLFRLMTDMPVGAGLGASTAARVALARAAGVNDPWRIARACLLGEGASDPLMFDRPERLLWASRRGQVLEHVPPLPEMEILGGFYGPPQRTDAADSRFPDVTDLALAWRDGGGLPLLAGLASRSAARCLALRGPADDPTAALGQRLGALGWCMAHTGSARGLIFAPGAVPAGAETALQRAGFTGITRFRSGGGG